MNGIITKEGFLQVERNGKLKQQFCPFLSGINGSVVCGDECAMFGELEKVGTSKRFELELNCGKGQLITITKDERE